MFTFATLEVFRSLGHKNVEVFDDFVHYFMVGAISATVIAVILKMGLENPLQYQDIPFKQLFYQFSSIWVVDSFPVHVCSALAMKLSMSTTHESCQVIIGAVALLAILCSIWYTYTCLSSMKLPRMEQSSTVTYRRRYSLDGHDWILDPMKFEDKSLHLVDYLNNFLQSIQ